jgi:hypothetical protein
MKTGLRKRLNRQGAKDAKNEEKEYNGLVMEHIRAYLDDERFGQWTLVSAAGWAGGLVLGGLALVGVVALTLLTRSTIPFIGLALAGAVVGGCVGLAQRAVLQEQVNDFDGRRWLRASAIGGAIGAFPAILASFITQVSWLLGFAAVGAIFGAAVGAAQWWAVRGRWMGGRWWLAAYALGGMLCGIITIPPHPLLLPLCCPLATLVMGAATGVAVMKMLSEKEFGMRGEDGRPEEPI